MYLANLKIVGFRRLAELELQFQPGLNVIVGPNNVGKSAVIDALRALLGGPDDPFPRFTIEDIHQSSADNHLPGFSFRFEFSGLTLDDEANFLPALRPDEAGTLLAVFIVRYSDPDTAGRLKARRFAGELEEIPLTSEMMEHLRGVFLPALRDASQGLRPGKSSQLSRLLQMLADQQGREAINADLEEIDETLKRHTPIQRTQSAIVGRHQEMLGTQLAQLLEIGLAGSDFQRLAGRLSLSVDNLDIELNGLGYNNLIFMAVVLSELAKDSGAAYRSLIIEEPEAHLHPQLQAVLLRYLIDLDSSERESVQIFVTSHSPNFACRARLDSLVCLFETDGKVAAFFPRNAKFEKGKKEKLERYLDVTRAELFFARRILLVEGASELILVSVIAEKLGHSLRKNAVSLISVEGLNFDCFLPLFGEHALRVPVSILTDADPAKEHATDGTVAAIYPAPNETVSISENTHKMKQLEDSLVKVFHGVKTFEYDLALIPQMRALMLEALQEMHPRIHVDINGKVEAVTSDQEKAEILFRGMFERSQNNVQKGRFGQVLSGLLLEKQEQVDVPQYIVDSIKHVCQVTRQ